MIKRLFWHKGRFSWIFVTLCALGAMALIVADVYWRTHETNFSAFF